MNTLVRGALVAAVALSSLCTAPAALAANHDNSCNTLEVCAFKDANYGGGLADMSQDNASWLDDKYSSGGSAHDSASSGFNLGRPVEYWVDVNFGGAHFILADSQYDSFWSTNQPNASSASFDFNDKVDSSWHYIP